MDERPSATVAFLFTDIEGSSRRWEEDPREMAGRVESHDRIVTGAVEAHGGEVFSTAGDSCAAVFATAAGAVEAALEAQHGLEGVLPVRMAVHAGPAQHRDGDYFGPTLNRCGRLREAAHGGQVVCSQAVVDLLADHPIAVDVSDLGEHRLKDLSRPEHIYQLSGVGLGAAFPALKTMRVELSNLPVQVNSFIGRHQEIAEIEKALHASRLVTLTGAGGCGKSRLALEAAAAVFDEYPHGAWIVELASISDPDLVPQAVATVFGLQERPEATITDSLVNYLKRRRLLVILDNCEHLLEPAAELVAAILSGTHDSDILATSREPLHTHGETIYPVPPLPTPSIDTDPIEVTHNDAVRLFTERAAAAIPDFHLTTQNTQAVASICRRLDGIPLAIELAAATTRMLPPGQIEARLDDRFRLLRHGPRGHLPHHRTLEAAIDWSYRLLTPDQQTLLARLAVFRGGWTLEAAEAVCSGDRLDATRILPLLTDLVDRSLVVATSDGPEPRYRFLETVGAFARERNGVDPDLRLAHGRHFLALAQQLSAMMESDRTVEALDAFAADLDNLRAALSHFDHTEHAGDYCLLLIAMRWFIHIRRMYSDMDRWVKRALETLPQDIDPSTHGQLLLIAAFNANRGHGENPEIAAEFCHRAIPPLTEAGDDKNLSEALSSLGLEGYGDDYSQQGLKAAIRSGNKLALARSHRLLGIRSVVKGDYPTALAHLQRALDAEPGPLFAGFTTAWTGLVHDYMGNTDKALELYDQALELFQQVHDPAGIKSVHQIRIHHHIVSGDSQAALHAIETSIDLKLDYLGGITPGSHAIAAHASIISGKIEDTLHHLQAIRAIPTDTAWWRMDEDDLIDHAYYAVAQLALRDNDPATTAVALAAGEAHPSRALPAVLEYADNLSQQAKTLLDPDQFDTAWQHGTTLALNDIIDLALDRYGGEED